MTKTYGASPHDWDHFSLILGLTADLLPVVSNPEAKISPDSKMKGLGKTPSSYNRKGYVAGFHEWTSYQSTLVEIEAWRRQPDYGICVQTRLVRAFDIDVEDAIIAEHIAYVICDHIGMNLPTRFRSNSSKCLLAFQLPGELPKRVIRLQGGIIELLGTGQQFIARGTHPSGARYLWDDITDESGLPYEIPELTLEQVDAIWAKLEAAYAVEPSSTAAAPSKAKKLAEAIGKDPTAQFLIDNGWVKSTERDGRLHITCPFEDGHSVVSADSSTSYFPANTGGYQFGHFACLHASCEHRTDDDFKAAIGVPVDDPFSDFENLDLKPGPSAGQGTGVESSTSATLEAPEIGGKKLESADAKAPNLAKPRFTVVPAHEFAVAKRQEWIIKGVLPKAEVGVVYGDSGSGKTFLMLDMVGAIARGVDWREHKVKQGGCVYICAEGSGGFRGRLKAYGMEKEVDLASLPIGVIADAPNFMAVQDVIDVVKAIRAFGKPSLVVVDTFAQVMAGSNENAGEDVGKALAHCKQIHKHTGAMVVLIHHSGKDSSKGARGWSGLRAAAEFEMEVARGGGEDRVATLTKLKDGVDGTEFGFKLKQIPIDLDEDDELVTSCVVERVDVVHKVVGPKNTKADKDAIVLRALADLEGLSGERVSFNDLKNSVAEYMGPPPPEGKRDNRGGKAVTVIQNLLGSGRLIQSNGFIHMPDDG